MKYLLITILFMCLVLIEGSPHSKIVPLKVTDFKLSYAISNPSPRLGDSIEVKATLQNITNRKLEFIGGDKLIYIRVVKPGDPDYYVDDMVGGLHKLESLENKDEAYSLVLDKPGEYSVYITTTKLSVWVPPSSNDEPVIISRPKKGVEIALDPIKIYVK